MQKGGACTTCWRLRQLLLARPAVLNSRELLPPLAPSHSLLHFSPKSAFFYYHHHWLHCWFYCHLSPTNTHMHAHLTNATVAPPRSLPSASKRIRWIQVHMTTRLLSLHLLAAGWERKYCHSLSLPVVGVASQGRRMKGEMGKRWKRQFRHSAPPPPLPFE